MGDFTTIDLVVVVAYFFAVGAIGVHIARKTHTGDDLFLAGRSLRWPAIGLSLFASNISSTTLIGLSGAAYASGIAVSAYEWMAAVVLIFMAAVFLPLYLRTRITTIPEYLEVRFGGPARRYFSAITIFLSIVVDTAGGLYAGALVLRVFFPDLVIWQTCAVLAVVAGLYTAAGGLAAVVYTDVIQAVVLLLGTTLLTWYVFEAYDFSWSAAMAATPADHLHLIRPLDDPDLPWLGLLTGVPILGFWYWATNQYITQRVLGARNLTDARRGAILGGALKLIPLFTMVLPGALAVGLYPDLANPDLVFPTLVTDLLPVGITGLVMAGLIAAIMSSIDSTLNSASTLVVWDFVRHKRPDLDAAGVARWGRGTTLVLMVVAAVWAPMIASMGGLFEYLQQAFAIVVPPVAAVFLLGALTSRGSSRTAIGTLIAGHALGLLVFILGQLGHWPLHFTLNAGLMTAVSIGIYLVLSASDPITADGQKAVWHRGLAKPEHGGGLLGDYRVLSIAVAILTVLMVIGFW